MCSRLAGQRCELPIVAVNRLVVGLDVLLTILGEFAQLLDENLVDADVGVVRLSVRGECKHLIK